MNKKDEKNEKIIYGTLAFVIMFIVKGKWKY